MEIITATTNTISTTAQQTIGQQFNRAAAENVFSAYLADMKPNTKTRHEKELKNFSLFLTSFGYENNGMTTPDQWSGITFGLIEGYKNFMLNPTKEISVTRIHRGKEITETIFTPGTGRSVNTVNQTIYIIKAYARMAGKAGYITAEERENIRDVSGMKTSQKAARDKARKAEGISTRTSTKKEKAVNLTSLQVEQLKHDHPDTITGKRDKLIFALFLDMGLRESELLALTPECFDMENKMIHWHREKTENDGHETMSRDIYEAAADWLPQVDQNENVICSINKHGQASTGLTAAGIKYIVRETGKKYGLNSLSPHDLRHSMATRAYLAGIPLKSIQRRLGHSTVKTTERYIDIESLNRYSDFDKEF